MLEARHPAALHRDTAMMKSFIAFALAASTLTSAGANAAVVRFGGTFSDFAPNTRFSRPGADFTVQFDTPLRILDSNRGIRQIDASVTFDGIRRSSRAFFNPSVIPSGQDAGLSTFTLSFSDFFSFSGTNFSVLGFDFFRQTTREVGRLRQGTFNLFSGDVSASSGFAFNRSPILNLSDLQIGNFAATSRTFSAFGSPLILGSVAVSNVPGSGSVTVLAGGVALIGVALRLRRRRLVAA